MYSVIPEALFCDEVQYNARRCGEVYTVRGGIYISEKYKIVKEKEM